MLWGNRVNQQSAGVFFIEFFEYVGFQLGHSAQVAEDLCLFGLAAASTRSAI